MFEEKFNSLSTEEQSSFQRILNWLLAHTFLLESNYNFNDGLRRVNQDYLFVQRNFDVFTEYLSYSGFKLERNDDYGIISLSSEYDYNRFRMDKLATLMIYTLRLMFEEEREKLSLRKDVFVTVGELVARMIALGVIPRKPANTALADALRTLNKFQVVDKGDGEWDNPNTSLFVKATILFIVNNDSIANIYNFVENKQAAKELDDHEDS